MWFKKECWSTGLPLARLNVCMLWDSFPAEQLFDWKHPMMQLAEGAVVGTHYLDMGTPVPPAQVLVWEATNAGSRMRVKSAAGAKPIWQWRIAINDITTSKIRLNPCLGNWPLQYTVSVLGNHKQTLTLLKSNKGSLWISLSVKWVLSRLILSV